MLNVQALDTTFMICNFPYFLLAVSLSKCQREYIEDCWKLVARCKHKAEEWLSFLLSTFERAKLQFS